MNSPITQPPVLYTTYSITGVVLELLDLVPARSPLPTLTVREFHPGRQEPQVVPASFRFPDHGQSDELSRGEPRSARLCLHPIIATSALSVQRRSGPSTTGSDMRNRSICHWKDGFVLPMGLGLRMNQAARPPALFVAKQIRATLISSIIIRHSVENELSAAKIT